MSCTPFGSDPIVRKRRHDPWTAEELAILRENYGKMPLEAVGELVGRSREAVRARAIMENLRKPAPVKAIRKAAHNNSALQKLAKLPEGITNVKEHVFVYGCDADYVPENDEPSRPCTAKPGSHERIEELARRVREGEPLWHTLDKRDYE